MDPVSIIVAAVVAGAGSALTDTVKDEVKAAYSALRKALLARFSDKRSVTQGVERLEEQPENVDRREALAWALTDERAADDAELMALARSVVAATGGSAINEMDLGRYSHVKDSPQHARAGAGGSAANRLTVGEGATVSGSGQTADASGSSSPPPMPAPTESDFRST